MIAERGPGTKWASQKGEKGLIGKYDLLNVADMKTIFFSWGFLIG